MAAAFGVRQDITAKLTGAVYVRGHDNIQPVLKTLSAFPNKVAKTPSLVVRFRGVCLQTFVSGLHEFSNA